MSHPPGSVNRVSEGEVLVRARGLTKRFGDFTAVDGIDFDLYRGEAFGFLGPNGAGKSSTMRMIGCVSPPTSGDLTILGRDPVRDGSAIRARLGVVPQEDTLDMERTVRENLLVYGRYFGLPGPDRPLLLAGGPRGPLRPRRARCGRRQTQRHFCRTDRGACRPDPAL